MWILSSHHKLNYGAFQFPTVSLSPDRDLSRYLSHWPPLLVSMLPGASCPALSLGPQPSRRTAPALTAPFLALISCKAGWNFPIRPHVASQLPSQLFPTWYLWAPTLPTLLGLWALLQPSLHWGAQLPGQAVCSFPAALQWGTQLAQFLGQATCSFPAALHRGTPREAMCDFPDLS